MITLKSVASAILVNGDDVLLMKRALTKTLSPGHWAPVGGHIEPHEFTEPETACLREIFEETGIPPEAVRDFTLRYIHMRREGDRIGQQYVFVGRTDERNLIDTDEGELFWIPRDRLFDREFPIGTEAMLRDWLAAPPDSPVKAFMKKRNADGIAATWRDYAFVPLEEL